MPISVNNPKQGVFNVSVDTTGLDNLESKMDILSKKIMDTVKDLGEQASELWESSASSKLKSSDNYIAAVKAGNQYPANGNKFKYVIEPKFKQVGGKDLGILLEDGYEPFDMKEKLLKGQDKKIINFKHSTESLSQQVKGAVNNHQFFMSYALGTMNPPDVNDNEIAMHPRRKKSFTVINPTKNRFPNHDTKKPVNVNYLWKVPKFKNIKKSGKDTFSTFRTISKKSSSDSWINPGQVPKKIFSDAMERFAPVVTRAFQEAVADALK